jgi:hypothetical protein
MKPFQRKVQSTGGIGAWYPGVIPPGTSPTSGEYGDRVSVDPCR